MLHTIYASAQIRIAVVVAIVIVVALSIAPTVVVLADTIGGGH
jgi:hypothetical protein